MLTEQPQSSREIVYSYIQSQMKKGFLLPGSVLNLKLISSHLGISNTPLRDALIKLEAEGILTIYPRSKVVINALELEDFPYLYGMMGTIEYTAISQSIDIYTKENIQELMELNRKMKEAIDNDMIIEYDKLHYSFHSVFFKVSPNLFAERILAPIKNRLWEFPRKNFYKKWYYDAINEHELIVDNIEKKNLQALYENITQKHWGFAYNKDHIIKEYQWLSSHN